MSKTMPAINDVVSLTIMLLMIIALVAAQAGAADYQVAVSSIERAEAVAAQERTHPLRASLNAHFDITPLAISIDASAEIRQLLFDDE
ncbi:MAG: hypothetical protein WBM87_03240 [Woeseiaceae bacterium]